MPTHRETLLCRYRYDPLDRLADCTPTAQASTQRFYLNDRLTTEIQGTIQRSIIQHEDQLLAQQQRQNGTRETRLLATDQQRSVLTILDATRPHHLAYTPYGHRIPENGLLSLLGFNGERPDPMTGHYLLGNGYRAFNPVLMRFNSPDSWSPFGEGGVNAYSYAVGNPSKYSDPTGHGPFDFISTFFSRTPKPTKPDSFNIFQYGGSNRQATTRWGERRVPETVSYKRSKKRHSLPEREMTSAEHDLIGYHGTDDTSANRLLNEGVNQTFFKSTSFGSGFYVSPNLEVAQKYAGLSNNSRGQVVEVYMSNFSGMKPGIDYDFKHHDVNPTLTMEMVIKPHRIKSISIRTLDSNSGKKKSTPRALEAHF
ncbi:RHS repeat-associated core domain-containing protein [Pseudomonas sp. FW300-N1A1]|uniref:RHS repeat-associated core domain-containing protein n=1 Tax=Pseudomonas sp. FW300-N1A1 TaxID=2075555 RepID=UPI002113F017|nr:RHS repeat-associated core domain-containing protein [Pseudomonas sp. FW300-N1A1]